MFIDDIKAEAAVLLQRLLLLCLQAKNYPAMNSGVQLNQQVYGMQLLTTYNYMATRV